MSKFFNKSGKTQFYIFMILISLLVFSSGCVFSSGNNSSDNHTSPRFIAISAGGCHNLALRDDGTVVAWGCNQNGESDVPKHLTKVIAISANPSPWNGHSLALKQDGTVVAWGDNEHGQSNVPEYLTDVIAISAGPSFSLAVKKDGTVVAWGQYNDGRPFLIPKGNFIEIF